MNQQTQSYLVVEEIRPTSHVPLKTADDLGQVHAVEKRIIAGGFWGVDWREFSEEEKLAVVISHQAGRIRLARLTYVCPSGPVNGEFWGIVAVMK